MKKAFITGIGGQDGSYLAELLLEKGYFVYGLYRNRSELLDSISKHPRATLFRGDLLNRDLLDSLIQKIKPDEVYNLAAMSHRETASLFPEKSAEINALAPLRLLEILKTSHPSARFFQASSAEIFGSPNKSPQTEETEIRPFSSYAAAKYFAHCSVIQYRDQHQLFACNGILYNHESPRRSLEFVSRKISSFAAKIAKGDLDTLFLGNLDAKRDWSYAKDFAEGIWQMLQQQKPDDYILASGKPHSVREFVELAFQKIGIELLWHGQGIHEVGIDSRSKIPYVRVSPQFFRPLEIVCRFGSPIKAKKKLGWSSKTTFEELVSLMVEKDIERISSDRSLSLNRAGE